MRKRQRDWSEVQAALLRCAGDETCERVSAYVIQAIRPSWGQRGKRTDLTVFGVCLGHQPYWREIAGRQGYWDGVCVRWEDSGSLLDEMVGMGWDLTQAVS